MAKQRLAQRGTHGEFRVWGICLLAWCVLLGSLPGVWAQVARVASVQRSVEKRSGGVWRKVGAGASLNVGESLRTGKRSKVDLKFADGSLIRLGALSSIDIQSAKGVRLGGGQILFSALRPGRVLAGSGTAEIRGSVAIIALGKNGVGNFALFSGAMDVTANEQTVNVPVGQSLSANVNGTLSPLRPNAPFGFSDGTYQPDLLGEPESGPFAGSGVDGAIRDEPDRRILNDSIPSLNPVIREGIVFGNNSTVPFPTPFPPDPLLRATRPEGIASTATSDLSVSSPSLANWANYRRINALPLDEMLASEMAEQEMALRETAFDLDTRPAREHLDEVNRNRGAFLDADAALIGAIGDGGLGVYGARVRGLGARGKLYFEGNVLPLRLRGNGNGGSRDLSSFSNSFVTYRDTWGEVQAGRQRFTSGPTQAAAFGSLVRQGGHETMDALRIAPRLSGGKQLELAYIYDAFPRNAPFQISGAQRAFYGRAGLRKRNFNLGLNAFKYSNAPVNDTVGVTLDFAVPLRRDEVELYGEVGRDAFARRLTTVGLAFPGLYDRTDVDAFLEYARLQNPSGNVAGVNGVPSEIALRAYRRVGSQLNAVASISRFGDGEGWNFVLGVTLGGRGQRDGRR